VRRKIQLITFVVFSGFACLYFFPAASSADNSKSQIDFDREVRPILSDNCFACHGPDENQRRAKLRFDTKEGAFAKPGVITPGDASKSKLYQRVSSKDQDMVMPPPSSEHKLTEKQIETIRRWIDEGARWDEHWAFTPPKRPEIPKGADAAWVRNPIDSFILARLGKEGLKPQPEADKTTLLRRVYLDLTGLPPTPADVDAFLADKSAGAYEKVVDKLLASPRYGERMAMVWLDLARYADTHGYHIDSHRDMWVWRDWLIRAFNENKRFDQFTIEQLAGDLLPDATQDQKIATGFNRNHMINFEGGAIPEEYLNEYVIDRVETTATTWLGLTIGCARCHTHKYDPISQKEFYQFYAFFNSVPEVGLDGRTGNAAPMLPLPTDEQKAEQRRLTGAIQDLTDALSDKNVAPLKQEWEKTLSGRAAVAPFEKIMAHYELDGSLADSSGHYRQGRTLNGDPTFGGGMVSRAVSLDGQTTLSFGDAGAFGAGDQFTFALWMRPGIGKIGNFAFQKIEDEKTRRGYELIFEKTHLIDIQRWAAPLTVRLISNWPDGAIVVRTKESFNNNEWKHLAFTYDGSGRAAGLKVFLNGKFAEVEVVKDALNGPINTGAELVIGGKQTGRAYSGGLDDMRIYSRVLGDREIEDLAVHYPVRSTLSGVGGKRTKEEEDRLREYFLTEIAPEEMRRKYVELKEVRKRKQALDKAILNTMVMMELGKPRDTFILTRGDYRNKTEKVAPGVPAVLQPLPKDEKVNRLTLAKWLVDPNHPLTSRVAVNRFWQMYFGHGIVKTVEDFGAQGEPPVHPELLDWLAAEFMNPTRRQGDVATGRENGDPQSKGWDVKAMQRLIVTSATYRQSSRVTPELREKDPENRLLARGPRYRLSAEIIRDNALAVSGLLNDEIGGRSVLPYQPSGLWEEMAFGDGFSMQEYVQSHGKDLYRRSMYTFWKRTVPPAAMATFDAPDREKCVARRAVTNTPLQALVTLNDPTYVEAARAMAERTLREGGKNVSGRVAYVFRLALARNPSAQEAKVLRDLASRQLTNYRKDRKAAGELLRVGESKADEKIDQAELAAWTMVASAILNLDETITKE
jgi:mono/diheme cytochrome c family protein